MHLDMSCPRLTVLGLHPRPQQTAMPPEKARHKATEPAWRLPHAVTLLHNSRSTKRAPKCIWHIDMVHHPHDLHDTKRASPRHICRAVKQTRKGLQHAYSTSTTEHCTPPVSNPSPRHRRAPGRSSTATGYSSHRESQCPQRRPSPQPACSAPRLRHRRCPPTPCTSGSRPLYTLPKASSHPRSAIAVEDLPRRR